MAVDRYNRPEYHFGRQPKYYSSPGKEEIFSHDAARIKMSKIFSRSNKISQYSILKLVIFTFSRTKFQGHRSIWAWRPCWSCDSTQLYKFSFPFSLKLFFFCWTDARRLVPRLWIRSAEVRGGGGRH